MNDQKRQVLDCGCVRAEEGRLLCAMCAARVGLPVGHVLGAGGGEDIAVSPRGRAVLHRAREIGQHYLSLDRLSESEESVRVVTDTGREEVGRLLRVVLSWEASGDGPCGCWAVVGRSPWDVVVWRTSDVVDIEGSVIMIEAGGPVLCG